MESNMVKACRLNDLESLKISIAYTDEDSRKGLKHACRNNNMEIVKYLIDTYHYDVSDLNAGFETACFMGQLRMAKYMLEKGANALRKGLVYACWFGSISLVKYLLETYNIDTSLTISHACHSSNLELIKYLVKERKSDITNTCITNANLYGRFEIAKYLIEQRKNVSDVYISNYTACKLLNVGLDYKLLGNNAYECMRARDITNEKIKKIMMDKTAICIDVIDVVCSYTVYT